MFWVFVFGLENVVIIHREVRVRIWRWEDIVEVWIFIIAIDSTHVELGGVVGALMMGYIWEILKSLSEMIRWFDIWTSMSKYLQLLGWCLVTISEVVGYGSVFEMVLGVSSWVLIIHHIYPSNFYLILCARTIPVFLLINNLKTIRFLVLIGSIKHLL